MKDNTSSRGAGRLVVLFVAAVVFVLFAGWGAMTMFAQPADFSSQGSQTRSGPMAVSRPQDSASVQVDSWEQSAELVRAHVGDVRVNGRPLVRVGSEYSVDRRIIHDEQSRAMAFPVELSEAEWRQRLSPEQYRIIRESGTERAFTSELDKIYEPGIYYSRATGQPLFSSEDKYDSRTGWPSFTKPITPDAVAYFFEASFFSRNVEVVDSLSGAHLGHVFADGPGPTNQRYCMNGEALIFVPEGGDPPPLLVPSSLERS